MASEMSDEELALRVADGSRPAYEELVCRYAPRLFHFFRSRLGSDQDAQDLVQETCLKSYRSIGRYSPEWKFSTWIYTTATRLAISQYRKQGQKLNHPPLTQPGSTPEDRMIEKQEAQSLWSQARQLRLKQYQTLWLRYAEDMSTREIADVLRITPIQVRVLLHRGRSNLAKLIHPLKNESEGSQKTKASKKAPMLYQEK